MVVRCVPRNADRESCGSAVCPFLVFQQVPGNACERVVDAVVDDRVVPDIGVKNRDNLELELSLRFDVGLTMRFSDTVCTVESR